MDAPILMDGVAVASYLGIGRVNFYKMKKDPDFPEPVKLYEGQQKKQWTKDQLDAFVAKKAAKAGKAAKK